MRRAADTVDMDLDRRTLLRRVGLAGGVALAGCAGDGGDDTVTETDAGGTTEGTAMSTETDAETATEPGTGAATSTETETATETPTETPTETESGPQSSVTVSVGANGQAQFEPETFVLEEGGTVTWEWVAGGHNVVVESQPDGADWSGTPGGPSTTYDRGYTYEERFDVAGEYEYYCQPHRSFGMTGSFTVE